MVGSELTKFSADDALLLQVSCQDPGHKFGCETVHAQFFYQNPLACPITNFHLFSNVTNGPTSILTDELLNLCNLWVSVCSSSTNVRPVLNRACHWNTCVQLKLWSLKPCWIISRVSVALFPRLAQNLMHTHCSFLWSIAKIATCTYMAPNERVWKMPTSTQLRATWHTDSLDVVVLPYTGASRYHNCCIDGGTGSENFGYHLVYLATSYLFQCQKLFQKLFWEYNIRFCAMFL